MRQPTKQQTAPQASVVCWLEIQFVDELGGPYQVAVHAERIAGHVWAGWLEFIAEKGEPLATDHETTQTTRAAVARWARGLGALYVEGALARARRRARVAPLPRPVPLPRLEAVVSDGEGGRYQVRGWAEPEPHGTWIGWLEFLPLDCVGTPRRTGHETSQPSLRAVAYWVRGLQPLYLDGALARSSPTDTSLFG